MGPGLYSCRGTIAALAVLAAVFTVSVTAHAISYAPAEPASEGLERQALRVKAARQLGLEWHHMRRLKESGHRVLAMEAFARRYSEGESDPHKVVPLIQEELAKPRRDWERVLRALRDARGGPGWEHEGVDAIRQILEWERGEKISDEHGNCLREAIRVLGMIGRPQATALLNETKQEEFWWKNGPVRARTISEDPVTSIRMLARLADAALDREGESEHAKYFPLDSLTPAITYGDAERLDLTRLRQTADAALDSVAYALWEEILSDDMPPDIISRIKRETYDARHVPVDARTQQALLEELDQQVQGESPDWALVDQILWTVRCFEKLDADFLPVLRSVLKYPRALPMHEFHRESITAALFAIPRVQTDEAAALLLEATSQEFWKEGGPLETPSRWPEAYDPVEQSRIRAIGAMGQMPAQFVREQLESIQEAYRGQRATVAGAMFEAFRYQASLAAEIVLKRLELREGSHSQPEIPAEQVPTESKD